MRISASLLLVASALLLGGCTQAAPAPSTPPPSPTPSPTASGRPTPAPTASVDPSAPQGQCPDADLSVSIAGQQGAAGSIVSAIVFTNTGSSACVLEGAPGVSVVGRGDGTQLGVPAQHPSGAAATPVTIAPGGRAAAALQSVNIAGGGGALGGSCTVVKGDGYRIYAPHSFHASFVSSPGVPACTGTTVWMSVQPVVAYGG